VRAVLLDVPDKGATKQWANEDLTADLGMIVSKRNIQIGSCVLLVRIRGRARIDWVFDGRTALPTATQPGKIEHGERF
jgi:hypothetical protein